MTVVLNEAALKMLLDSETGPVGLFIAAKAQQITLAAQNNVRNYFWTAPTLTVDQDVGFVMQGSNAIVGIRDGGEKSRRLATSQAQGKVNWLTSALEAGRL
jgi:hypothetical protein